MSRLHSQRMHLALSLIILVDVCLMRVFLKCSNSIIDLSRSKVCPFQTRALPLGNRASDSRCRRKCLTSLEERTITSQPNETHIHIRVEIPFPENSRTFYFKESAAQNPKESKGRPRRRARLSRVGGHIRRSTR